MSQNLQTKCPDASLLTAYAEARLEGRKRERVEGHLHDCAGCKTALERIENARAALKAMATFSPPPASAASSARLEATLRWTQTGPRPRVSPLALSSLFESLTPRRLGYLAAAASLTAAVSWAGYRAIRHRGEAPAAVELAAHKQAPAPARAEGTGPRAEQPVPVVEPREAVVTLVGGDVRLVAMDGSEARLDPGHTLREGEHVVTGKDGRLAFQWGEGSGALLEAGSELRLSRLLPRSQELGLSRGRISVRVGPHQPGESMSVRSPDHLVTVHGTWFIVSVQPRGTRVDVLEGVVEVSSSAGDAASTRLPAPSRASFHRGSGIADDNHALTGREAQTLRAGSEMGLLPWSSLAGLLDANGLVTIAPDPPAQVVVDGVAFGSSPLELRRPRGRHLVELSRPGFATLRSWVSVEGPGSGGAWTPALLRDEAADAVLPSPEVVEQVVDGSKKRMQACFERVLKRDPTLAGTMMLQLKLGPAGQVLRTDFLHDTLKEPQVNDCLRKESATWIFPKARNTSLQVGPLAFHGARTDTAR